MRTVPEENREPNTVCTYNKGVECFTPLHRRKCNKCGWRPVVDKRRREAIKNGK